MNSPHAPVVALVPIRSLGAGKSRLAEGLDDGERSSLAAAMLADVIAALRAAPVDRVVVAAGGQDAGAAAGALGVDVVMDPPHARGLDDVVHAAHGRLGAIGTLLVVMADLPRLHPRDIAAVIEADAPVVVAATADGGTGALLRRPPGVMGTAYGLGSAGRHARLAHAAGVRPETLDLPGLRDDVDTWDDLTALRSGNLGRFTANFVAGIADRLEVVAPSG